MTQHSDKNSLFKRVVYILLILISLILFNILISDINLSLDLTKQKTYTLSNFSKEQIRKFNDPLRIEFYIAKNLPSHVIPYKNKVTDLLKEYERYSNGNISLTEYKKESNVAIFKQLNSYGIPKIQMNIIEEKNILLKYLRNCYVL